MAKMGINPSLFQESGPHYLPGGAGRASLVLPEGDGEGEAI